jgi:hypothetical protein
MNLHIYSSHVERDPIPSGFIKVREEEEIRRFTADEHLRFRQENTYKQSYKTRYLIWTITTIRLYVDYTTKRLIIRLYNYSLKDFPSVRFADLHGLYRL